MSRWFDPISLSYSGCIVIIHRPFCTDHGQNQNLSLNLGSTGSRRRRPIHLPPPLNSLNFFTQLAPGRLTSRLLCPSRSWRQLSGHPLIWGDGWTGPLETGITDMYRIPFIEICRQIKASSTLVSNLTREASKKKNASKKI